MYRIPKDLDLSLIVGEFTTQVRVGPFDLSFTFGESPNRITFSVLSAVELFRNGERLARWEAGEWPGPGFYEIMNVEITRWGVPNDREIVLSLANGIDMYLIDDSDHYESMQISIEGKPRQYII